jgi:mannosyl-oligosaccharide alpha-1,2-mannosidase
MYARMKTGISPEYVEFVAGEDLKVGKIAPHYLLRPEAIESFYILNVLTGDPIYR